MNKKVTEFIITVNNPGPILAGDNLTGNVVLCLTATKEMKAISIKLKGIAYCEWKATTHDVIEGNEVKTYTNKEKIIKKEVILYGTVSKSTILKKFKHPPGKHMYPFCFKLPSRLPSSFTGEYGSVRYTLKAKIIRPWRFDRKIVNEVILRDKIDTNDPCYSQEAYGEKCKRFGFWCITTGRVILRAHIDRLCFTPGEPILINSTLHNYSRRDMRTMKACCEQLIKYKSSKGKKLEIPKEIEHIKSPIISRGSELKWENKPLVLPLDVPPTAKNKALSITYVLKVSVESMKGKNIEMKMPITVGTVPHNSHQVERQSVLNRSDYPIDYPSHSGYPDAPPSYSEVMSE